jgi:lipopolysaccharide biosynthesis glycosyltransferase
MSHATPYLKFSAAPFPSPPVNRHSSIPVAASSPERVKDPVHIVCAGNSQYMMPVSVMLVSLVANFSRQRDLIIHIISNDATAQDRENVRDSIKRIRRDFDHIELQWHTINAPLLKNLAIPGACHSSDVYARLFIPHLLPESCERAIYLDSDMVVLADVAELYDSTAESKAILHAARDVGIPWASSRAGVFDYVERGIPADAPNFSSAVMVMNLKQWRERNLTPTLLAYLAEHGHKVYVDQGALNAFLWRDWVPLDARWNQGPDIIFEEMWTAAGCTREEWTRTKNDPFIVHYAGSAKPWKSRLPFPRFSHFHKYLAKTVYAQSTRLTPHLEVLVGFRIYYRLWKAAVAIKQFGRHLFPRLFTPRVPVAAESKIRNPST